MGSRKTIRLGQEYVVKAGFDLEKPFWVEMGPGAGEVTACLPPAEILAVSAVGPPVYEDKDGWWNKVLSVPGVKEAEVELVWEPAWNQSMISEAGKMKLGWV